MSIERFYTTTFSVKRMEWANESAAEVVQGTFLGHLQQATPEHVQSMGLAFGKTFTIWCAVGTDVEGGDTLTVSSGHFAGTYNVKNVMQNAAVGSNQHLELTVVRDVL